MNILFLVGCISAALYLLLLWLKSILSLMYATSHPETNELDQPITVLQPILGGDPTLHDTLKGNLLTATTVTRFIWLVDEGDFAGRAVATPLSETYADQVQLVLCPDCPPGLNPKLYKLNLALPRVTTEFLAVLDDDTSLSPGQLQKAMAALAGCELYTGLPCYRVAGNLWSRLVAHFVNNNSALTYLSLLSWVGPLTINGMFYVLRTETLRSLNGFQPILERLCDDYALARLVRDQGGRIQQGLTFQRIQTSVSGPGHYLRLMHRWFLFANVLVRDQPYRIQILLVVFLGLPPVFLAASLLCLAGGWWGAGIVTSVLVMRHLLLQRVQRRIFTESLKLSWWISPVSEIVQPLHLAHACLSSRITWRSRTISVGRNGGFTQEAVRPS
jgi:ceramide glucosyltransferase